MGINKRSATQTQEAHVCLKGCSHFASACIYRFLELVSAAFQQLFSTKQCEMSPALNCHMSNQQVHIS